MAELGPQITDTGEIYDPNESGKSALRRKLEGWKAMAVWAVNALREGHYRRPDSPQAIKKRTDLLESIKNARPVIVDAKGNITYKE